MFGIQVQTNKMDLVLNFLEYKDPISKYYFPFVFPFHGNIEKKSFRTSFVSHNNSLCCKRPSVFNLRLTTFRVKIDGDS